MHLYAVSKLNKSSLRIERTDAPNERDKLGLRNEGGCSTLVRSPFNLLLQQRNANPFVAAKIVVNGNRIAVFDVLKFVHQREPKVVVAIIS